MSSLETIVEALLFLSPEPVSTAELAEACEATEAEVDRALDLLGAALDGRGVVLREVAGGYTLAAHPDAADAARRLLARPKTPPLTQAQAETLAIIAYLQPVSRPEIARIRGVGADSAVSGLLERGLIEEAGRADTAGSPVVYRVTNAFQRVFGIDHEQGLPGLSDFELTEDDHQALRARLHLVADQRAGQA